MDKVFKYCESEDFKGALPYNDLLIVQLDTDFMQQGEVSSTYKVELNGLSTEQIVHAMTNKLIELIGVVLGRGCRGLTGKSLSPKKPISMLSKTIWSVNPSLMIPICMLKVFW